MSHRPNMRHGVKPPHLEWRTIAVTSVDPLEFAAQLQTSLQGLSDAGFNIIAQYQRGPAHILLGQRTVIEQPHPPGPIPGPMMTPTPQRNHARVTSKQDFDEQFVYHFLSPEGPQDKRFTSMVEALRMVRAHVDGDGSYLPGYLVAMSVTTFEAPALGELLKEYALDLAVQPPKQVD